MGSLNIPNPIIFGSDFPKLRARVEAGNQYIYSLSNYNLYIRETDLTEDGTYPAGSLFNPMSTRFWGGATPDFVAQEKLALPSCQERLKPCPMIVESWDERQFKDDDSAEKKFTLTKVKLHEKPQLYQCKLLAALLNCSTTPAEKKFVEMYYTCVIAGTDSGRRFEPIFSKLDKKYGDFVQRWQTQQFKIEDIYRQPLYVSEAILTSLKGPALIPQVWLNYVYNPTQSPEEVDEKLEYMPMRVDFLFIWKNELHIVEIDDPSHYAKYDSRKRKYEVDEELYTKNLRAERTLRGHKFHLHRLSNWEVLNATESELIRLIPFALGIGLFYIEEASPHIPGMEKE